MQQIPYIPTKAEIAETMKYRISDMMELFKYYQLKSQYIQYLNTGSDPIILVEYYKKMRGIGLYNRDIFKNTVPSWATNGFIFEEKKPLLEAPIKSADKEPSPDVPDIDIVFSQEPIALCNDKEFNKDQDDLSESVVLSEPDITLSHDEDNDYDDEDYGIDQELDNDEEVLGMFRHSPVSHIDNIPHNCEQIEISNSLSKPALILCGKIHELSELSPSIYKLGDEYFTTNHVRELMNSNAIEFRDGIYVEHMTEDIKPYIPHSPVIYSLRYNGELFQTFRFSDNTTFAYRNGRVYLLPFITDFYVTYKNGVWRNFRDYGYECCGRNEIYLHQDGTWSFSYRPILIEFRPVSCKLFNNNFELFLRMSRYCNNNLFNYDAFIKREKFDISNTFMFRQILNLFGIIYVDYTYFYYDLAYPVQADRKIKQIINSFDQILNKAFVVCTPDRSVLSSRERFECNQKKRNNRRGRGRKNRSRRRFRERVYCSPKMCDGDIKLKNNNWKDKFRKKK